ncbi:MAG: hypothetical protein Q8S71_03865 [Hydrogenophaga sp.]|nr:hypothetical protein [Hydrogenophaga sp.]
MERQQELKITSEEDAFAFLKKALENEISDDIKITFDNWPKITIELEGEGYNSTLTPSIMSALLELQQGLNRTYAKLALDRNTRHLTDDERKSLEFKAKVEDGCTHITVDLQDIALKIIDKIGDKMTGNEITIVVVTAIIAWSSVALLKAYIASKADGKAIEQDTIKQVMLSEQETARLKVFADAVTGRPALESIEKDAKKTSISMLKGISDADSIEINGISINKEDAKLLSSNARAESSSIQLNGNYYILSVDTSATDEVKIRVLHLDSQREFIARFKDNTLDKTQIAKLQEAEWTRPKNKVYLSVNATELRGNITTAIIVSVTSQPT